MGWTTRGKRCLTLEESMSKPPTHPFEETTTTPVYRLPNVRYPELTVVQKKTYRLFGIPVFTVILEHLVE